MKRKRTKLGLTVAEWGRLPHELLVEILSRLPAKSLLLYKLVSKRWYNLIRDPHFIKSHVHQAIKRDDGVNLFLATEAHPTMTAIDFLEKKFYGIEGDSFEKCVQIENPLDYGVRVLGSCNGLVCLGSKNCICLLNPVTREYKIVRFKEELVRLKEEFGFSHKACYGIGYDDKNDDYLVVEIVRTDKCYDLYGFDKNHQMNSEVSVYSINDTSCSKLANIPYRLSQGQNSGIFLNGYVHWLADTKVFCPKAILTFDGKEKLFLETPRPDVLGCMNLGVLRGKLFVLCDIYQGDLELWVMRNYGIGDSWAKLYSIEKKYFCGEPTNVLCYTEHGKLLMRKEQKLVTYDRPLKQLWNIRYAGIDFFRIDTRIVHAASLVSLKSGTYLRVVHGAKSGKKRKEKVDLSWFASEDEEDFTEEMSEEDFIGEGFDEE